MTTDTDGNSLEPDLFAVIRDRWVLIVSLAVLFGLVGLLVGSTRPVVYQSTASVAVEDPRSAALFESSSSARPERYVETQVGIIESPAVAERAAEILTQGSPPIELSSEVILTGASVTSQADSDLISVTFESDSQEEAEAASNAMVDAYLELRSSEAIAGFANALAQLDESIAEAERELEALNAQIRDTQGTELIELQDRAEDLAARLAEIRAGDIDESDTDALAARTEEVTALSEQLQAIETVFRLETLQPDLAALLEDQRLAQSRLSELRSRRSEVSVDAELAGGGFVFQTQASPAIRTTPSPRAYAAIAAVIGLMTGVAIAYALAIWRRRISSAMQPETILQAPSLGSIPEFDVAVRSPLPVANATQSPAAEAFRFVMAAIESQMFRPGRSPNALEERLLLVTSATAKDGRSTIVANLALAAARAGRRVLVVDADFTSQRATELLAPDSKHKRGISDVLVGTASLESATVKTTQIIDGDLSLLSRGSDLMGAEDVFGSLQSADLLDSLREQYDLVLVDSPPLSAIGYATTLARLADRVLIVVRHRTQVSRLEELGQRLTLIQSRRIGYVYNRAPRNGDTRRVQRVKSNLTTVKEPAPLESALPNRE